MKYLLAIDPGVRGCGAALFLDGRLCAAGFAKSAITEGSDVYACVASAQAARNWVCMSYMLVSDVTELALEFPQIYQRGGGRTKGDPNALTPLAAIDGAIAAMFVPAQVRSFYPQQWKGSIEKPKRVSEPYAIRAKVEARLETDEVARIKWPENKKHGWDVIDAIGVGLYALGRFEQKRMFARE